MDSDALDLRTGIGLTKPIIVLIGLALSSTLGCYAPFRSPGTPAHLLPDSYRTPYRSSAKRLNLATLAITPPKDHILDEGDVLHVLIPGMFEAGQTIVPFPARIMADGSISLPNLEGLHVAGLNLAQAQVRINKVYKDRQLLVDPRVSVALAAPGTIQVTVLGAVTAPGVYSLPRYQNDIANAIGRAGGLTDQSADVIEVHRQHRPARVSKPQAHVQRQRRTRYATYGRSKIRRLPSLEQTYDKYAMQVILGSTPQEPKRAKQTGTRKGFRLGNRPASGTVLTIPLRGEPAMLEGGGDSRVKSRLDLNDVALQSGDVVVVPKQVDEVFFVVGPLSETRSVMFTVTDRSRKLGGAFVLPRDRDVDVVTAVAMAGYIDPLFSPTTVTVHRSRMGQCPELILVDLIKARCDWRENVYVQPGDIIYLNPDNRWWWRRTFNLIAPDLLTIPYRQAMGRWINPFAGR